MKPYYDVLILGGGLTGLSAGYFLKKSGRNDFLILEKEARAGGLCRTERRGDFLFDRCGHLLHFDTPDMKKLAARLLRGNLARHSRNSKIFSHNCLTDYPFQCNLAGLPDDVIVECIEEFVKVQKVTRKAHRSFGTWAESTFGKGIARHFMLPYNKKLWKCDPYQLTTEWMGDYVPSTNLRQLLEGALRQPDTATGYNAHFDYPVRGGIESLVKALMHPVRHRVETGCEVIAIDPTSHTVTLHDKSTIAYGKLISTLPLKTFIERTCTVPAGIKKAGELLRCSGVYNINLAIKGAMPEPYSWIYYPEAQHPFYRIGFYSSFAPENCKPGTTSLYVEIAYRNRPPNAETIYQQTVAHLQKLGFLRTSNDILETCCLDIPFAYVTCDKNWKHSRERILSWLTQHHISSIGRYGAWEYSDMESNMQQAFSTVNSMS